MMPTRAAGFAVPSLALGVALALGAPSGEEKLHGEWVGKDEAGQAVSLTFGPKNAVKIQVGKDSGSGTYAVDWDKKPVHLDFDWGERGKVQTIVEITDQGLRLENNNPGKERPAKFTDKAVVLTRPKEKK
jgi:hypothetical protein